MDDYTLEDLKADVSIVCGADVVVADDQTVCVRFSDEGRTFLVRFCLLSEPRSIIGESGYLLDGFTDDRAAEAFFFCNSWNAGRALGKAWYDHEDKSLNVQMNIPDVKSLTRSWIQENIIRVIVCTAGTFNQEANKVFGQKGA